MKLTRTASFLALLLPLFFLGSCVKDTCRKTITMKMPVFRSLTEVRNGMRSGVAQPVRHPGKIYTRGGYLFLNEVDKGIHVIDNSNPANPQKLAFIPIPGNVDLAVKGQYLYADSYADLVVFDLGNLADIRPVRFVDNVFPFRSNYYFGNTTNPDSMMVVVDYTLRDTVVDCDSYGGPEFFDRGGAMPMSGPGGVLNTAGGGGGGTGGSMARFAITGDHLYTVSTYSLSTFSISNPAQPQRLGERQLGGWNIETIFPFRDKLFIGSANGMMIYDISVPTNPSFISSFAHVTACDPVIADDRNAFVTLRTGTACRGVNDQLDVLDITNLSQPTPVRTYALTNPHGLAKDGDLLFICDGRDGLRVYNAAQPSALVPLQHITGIDTYDAIALGGTLLVVAKDGLYQYSYNSGGNLVRLSRIAIEN
ncbi:hypothetical protein [Flaviaesturariibacter amylovorans]|uniref:LVIVD repeat-containing protein n=1 Tax=Flaviaesturariibacter amylovorans TaxID=1084520 RepID=A0ABP8GGZ3_9BACT